MAGTQVTSPNQVTRYERKNIWQIIGFISVLILIFAYKLGIDSAWKIYRIYRPFYSTTGADPELDFGGPWTCLFHERSF